MVADVYGWPQSQCDFPSWLLGTSWRDLIGTNRYAPTLSHSTDVTANSHVWTNRHKAAPVTRAANSYKCITLDLSNETGGERGGALVILSHVMDGWCV